MKKIIVSLVLVLSFGSLLINCSADSEESCAFIPDTKSIDVPIAFESLTDSLLSVTTKQELVILLDKHDVLRDHFFKRGAYPDDSVFINVLFNRFTNPHIDTLGMEVRNVFGNEQGLREEFVQAFKNLKYYYPQVRIPRIQTVISGLETDLFVSDSLIIVGLDYFLGQGAKYRPNLYEYLLLQYNKENIVPSAMLLYGIDPRFNATNMQDKTMLADMIAYGKSFYFAKQMLPCTPDSVFIWYTKEETEGARANQDLIWMRFIENQLLYETSHMIKQRYLGERPKTIEVGEKCPGRIGQWVGWQIVNSYMKTNSSVSLQQLMQNADAAKIFKESNYKPVRK